MSTSSLFSPASCWALGMATSTLSGELPVMGRLANTGTVSAGAAGWAHKAVWLDEGNDQAGERPH